MNELFAFAVLRSSKQAVAHHSAMVCLESMSLLFESAIQYIALDSIAGMLCALYGLLGLRLRVLSLSLSTCKM